MTPEPTKSATPRTNAIEKAIDDYWNNPNTPTDLEQAMEEAKKLLSPFKFARQLETELAAANEKLEFLKSRGLTVVKMKTSDKPEPYLVYVIEPDSELSDSRTLRELFDAESRLTQIKKAGEKLADAANKAAEQWGGPLTQNHDPSFWKSIREAYASGFMRGFNDCASRQPNADISHSRD